MKELNFKHSNGAVLILVLIFCLVTAVIAQSASEIGVLQLKMVNNFKKHSEVKAKAEKELILIENKIANGLDIKDESVTFLQFLPDGLAFSEPQGVNYYHLTVSKQEDLGETIKIYSTFCVRKIDNLEDKSIDERMLHWINTVLKGEHIIDIKEISTNSDNNLLLIAHTKNVNNSTQVSFVRFPQGEIIRTFEMGSPISSKLLVVDTKTSGKADAVYMGAENSDLVKIAIDSNFSDEWIISYSKELIEGKIVGTPLMGHHPEGQGQLLYCLVENNKTITLQVFLQTKNDIKPYYHLDKAHFAQPLLWQGFLMASVNDNTLGIYDAFSGNELKTYPLKMIKQVIAQQDFAFPQVEINQPLDKSPQVVIMGRDFQKIAVAPILATSLGRRTWGMG